MNFSSVLPQNIWFSLRVSVAQSVYLGGCGCERCPIVGWGKTFIIYKGFFPDAVFRLVPGYRRRESEADLSRSDHEVNL